MRVGYTVRASSSMLLHPRQGIERLRGRADRRQDQRQKESLGVTASDFYGAIGAGDWAPRLHAALGEPWPCPASGAFDDVWDGMISDLTAAGVRVGMFSYGGWNDCDRAFAEAIWCILAHIRPTRVVETGVAHGLTSRIILHGLERNQAGQLWSIDLPAVDSALHSEIGMAVPDDLRSRWSYVAGTSRERLGGLLRDLGEIDLFVHDSLHTGRNVRFELETAWPALRTGGVAVVDDIDHSLAFSAFTEHVGPAEAIATHHVTGDGLWGIAIKGAEPARPSADRAWQPERQQASVRAARADSLRAVEANPHYQKALEASAATVRGWRHEGIEKAVVREIAYELRRLTLGDSRLLQIQAGGGQQTLLFRDQLIRPERPVIYDLNDERDPEARAETDFTAVDLEAAKFPAQDDEFDLVVWNRDLVTLKNVLPALREARRVLRPGGIMIVAVPNLAALHNRLLLLAGFQPTTLHINNGDHVRGFASQSMTRVLERDLGFRVQDAMGVGLAPISSAAQPRALRGLSHTVVWVLRLPGGAPPGSQADVAAA
jgi:ubiquinone/menaquinone biosynthesis C-methylase UbiE